MSESTQVPDGGTRWRRFGAVMVPGAAALVALGVMVSSGVLAASFAVSGQQFKVSADKLAGTGFEQFGGVDVQKDGTPHPVAISAIKTADLKNLCQSVVTPIPGLGSVSLVLKSSNPSADNLVVDATQLNGDATFTNINIGQDASTLSTVPGAAGAAGAFGQQADSVVINNLQQTAWATTAATFKLSGLNLSVQMGTHECF